MTNNPTSNFFRLAFALREFAKQQLPTVEKQVTALIKRKEKDPEIIECLLDVITWLMQMGVGKTQHERLHAYYMSVKQGIKR